MAKAKKRIERTYLFICEGCHQAKEQKSTREFAPTYCTTCWAEKRGRGVVINGRNSTGPATPCDPHVRLRVEKILAEHPELSKVEMLPSEREALGL